MGKKGRPVITVPPDDTKNEAYQITNAGTFQEGDIQITSTGLSIAALDNGGLQDRQPWVDDEIRASDIVFVEELGRGSGGVVKKVLYRPRQLKMALKVIPLNVADGVRQQILLELKTLYSAQCPNIIQFYGAYFAEGRIHIALELMDAGSLLSLMQVAGRFPEPVISCITVQVLLGLNYLHKDRHLIHRDIKPSNILLSTRGEVKITDFGVSGQLATTIASCKSWVGTVTYMSPERIQGQTYSVYSDIWSLGLSILELALGSFPYHVENAQSSQTIIKTAEEVERNLGFWDLLFLITEQDVPQLDESFSPEIRDFCLRCMAKNPADRPSAAELLEHPFIAQSLEDPPPVDLAEWVQQYVQAEPDIEWYPDMMPLDGEEEFRDDYSDSLEQQFGSMSPFPEPSLPEDMRISRLSSSSEDTADGMIRRQSSPIPANAQRSRSASMQDKRMSISQRVKRIFLSSSVSKF